MEMRTILKNSIFTNPIGWAQNAIKTEYNYRFLQIFTIIIAILLFIITFIISKTSFTEYLLAAGVIFFIVTIAFPLMYLKALRHLYLDWNQKNKLDEH